MPVTCLLVEHRGRGRYFFRWKLPCYLGLRPSHGHVGAHEWFAQRLYEGMIFFQRVQGLVRDCGSGGMPLEARSSSLSVAGSTIVGSPGSRPRSIPSIPAASTAARAREGFDVTSTGLSSMLAVADSLP